MNILSYLLPVPAVVGATVVGGRVGGAVVVGFPPGPPLRPGIQENLNIIIQCIINPKPFKSDI